MKKEKHFRSSVRLMIVVLLSAAMLDWAAPVQATVWCHDYTLYRVTCELSRCEDSNRLAPVEFRRRLKELGYDGFPITNTAQDPALADLVLKPGDVIILGDAHSGYVNADYTIDHFIQVYGESGTIRNVNNLPRYPLADGRPGGLFLGDKFGDFFGRLSPEGRRSIRFIEVWRRTRTPLTEVRYDLDGTWDVTVTFPQTFDKSRWEIRRSSFSSSAMWEIKRTLLSTNNPAKQGLIGQTSDEGWIEFKSDRKVYEYGSNKRPILEQATCTFSASSFSCEGTHQDTSHSTRTVSHQIKIEGTKVGSRAGSGANTGGSSGRTNNSGQNTGGRTSRYTPEQINTMRQWIAHYDNLVAQWTQYRDQRVAPYWNDRTYYQWARKEYQRCNQQIQLFQQYKAYYQNILRQAGLQ